MSRHKPYWREQVLNFLEIVASVFYDNFLDRQSIQRDLAGQITLCNGKTSFKPNLKPTSVRKHIHSEQECEITDKERDRERTQLSFSEIVSHKLWPKPIHPATKKQSCSEWIRIYQACCIQMDKYSDPYTKSQCESH